jgi:hypothetical protein
MTILSRNLNPLNDTKYARRRSSGDQDQLLNNVIQSLQGMGRTIYNYSGQGCLQAFEYVWGACGVHRDTKAILPLVYNRPQGSKPDGRCLSYGPLIRADLETIWLELGMVTFRREIGGADAPNSRIVVAEDPAHVHLEIIVYKGKASLATRADESTHFYEWEMVER